MSIIVKFINIRSSVSVTGKLKFNDGYFILSNDGAPDLSNPHKTYRDLKAICIYISSYVAKRNADAICKHAYAKALYVMTKLVAKSGDYAYFDKPVKCEYENKTYVLYEGDFLEIERLKKTGYIHGGESFLDDLSFLNDNDEEINPAFYCLFAAGDRTNPLDYRILQLWRFFEGAFLLQGPKLIDRLSKIGTVEVFEGWSVLDNKKVFKNIIITRATIKRFYAHYRCASAHASEPSSKTVIYPVLMDIDIDDYFEDFTAMRHLAKQVASKILNQS